MRWHDCLILITIGALLGGAYFRFRPDTHLALSQSGADGAYHDTYYVVAHFHYAASALLILLVALAVHVLLIRRAAPPMAASGAIAVCALVTGMALTTVPHLFLPRSGTPRRYIDYPETFEQWQLLSMIGASITTAALITLLVLAIRAMLWHRRRK